MNERAIAFLDMDGVLVDLHESILRAHQIEDPYSDTANLGEYNLSKVTGIPASELWRPLGEEFFANLNPTPWAYQLVEYIEPRFDEVYIATSPTWHPGCAAGKLRCIQTLFPRYARHYFLTPQKQLLAGVGRVLFDDCLGHCEKWLVADGRACLVPAPWNKRHGQDVMEVVRNYVERL